MGRKGDPFLLIVAFTTRGRQVEPPSGVAFRAIAFRVMVVERLPGHTMIEGRGAPTGVACISVALLPSERYGLVTYPTTSVLVVALKRPSGIAVIESRRHRTASLPVAPLAIRIDGGPIHVTLMTAQAWAVMLG